MLLQVRGPQEPISRCVVEPQDLEADVKSDDELAVEAVANLSGCSHILVTVR